MPFTTAADTTAITAVKNAATWISLHTGDTSTTGANEVTGGTYARVQATWGTVTAGSVTANTSVVINVPAGTTITYWGLWTASTGPTFYFGGILAASETFGAAGTYSLLPTLTAT
jgi:hypothetical protein